jgi:predicted transcriptional regulator
MQLKTERIKLTGHTTATLLYLYKNKRITNSKSNLFRTIYYTVISYLKKTGMVEIEGIDEHNEKIWRLTENGEKLAFHLNAIEELLEGKHGETDAL